MNFKQIEKQFKEEGLPIKLPSWDGYWKWENNTVMMYTKDKRVMDIRKTDDVTYTLNNLFSDKWIIATKYNCPLLGGKIELSFQDSVKYTERGCYMTRDAWTGGEYIYLEEDKRGISDNKRLMKYDGISKEYKPTYDDISTCDWRFRK